MVAPAIAVCLSVVVAGCKPDASDAARDRTNQSVSQANGCDSEDASSTPVSLLSVDVVIQIPDGPKRTSKVDRLPTDATVGDVMQRLAASDAFADIELSGSGERMFIPAIGEHRTSGGEGWMYELNGQWAKQGIGTQRISDGDIILWKYGTY